MSEPPKFTLESLLTVANTAGFSHGEIAVLIFHWLLVPCQDTQNAQIAAVKSKDNKPQSITTEQSQAALFWFTETKI